MTTLITGAFGCTSAWVVKALEHDYHEIWSPGLGRSPSTGGVDPVI